MQLGFVIDHARCIGCHACTVACKSENDVPLGKFRTWVKYTETGEFPSVRRNFAVLRCNQCSSAPCVTICPVRALEKRSDGIVDIDPAQCIGCKSCMQACPYDALYINEDQGIAEKCHFCAHRVERGLAPACAVVCPTEAIIPGDFDDPTSTVSQMRAGGRLTARKVEAETGPNVWYRDVEPTGIAPLSTHAAGGYLWANAMPSLNVNVEAMRAPDTTARTVYDVEHKPWWGRKVSGYLFTKSISAGAFLALVPSLMGWAGDTPGETDVVVSTWTWLLTGIGVLFLAITTGLLVGDLKRPERFLKILTHPNWSSWLVRGAIVLMVYGGLLTLWLILLFFEVSLPDIVRSVLVIATATAAIAAAIYSAWLFAQAKGRALWMQKGLPLKLALQALIAGCGVALLLGAFIDMPDVLASYLRPTLVSALGLHLVLLLLERFMAPKGREYEFHQATALLTRGPYAVAHWLLAVVVGHVLPLVWAVFQPGVIDPVAGAMALLGVYVVEDLFIRVGQALPIS